MMCSFCKQLKKHNEPYQEHKRNAEHSNWKQVINFTEPHTLNILIKSCCPFFEVLECEIFRYIQVFSRVLTYVLISFSFSEQTN